MDIVLGVSVTTTTVRMVLIEGEKADGVTIESAAFDTAAPQGVAKPSPSEQVGAAILATQQSALSSGHHLVASGVTWVDDPAPAPLSESIAARDLHNVVVVSEQNAAGALAQTVGRALGYDTTAVMLMKPATATLSIVDSADGSIVEARTCTLDTADPTDVLPEMITSLETRDPQPGGLFVVGSAMDVRSVKSNLQSLVSRPVIVPEEPELALARGAALAAANVPGSEASTSGLAYSQDPDDSAALDRTRVKLSDADTAAAPIDYTESDDAVGSTDASAGREVLIPIGSVAAAAFVIGAVALVMSLAVSIRPTVDQGSRLSEKATTPSAVAPPVAQAPAAIPALDVTPQAQPHQPPPPPESIPAPTPGVLRPPPPMPVVAPAHQARAPVSPIQQPAPSRVVAEPTQVAVEKPLEAAPVAVEPPPDETPHIPTPVAAPPQAPPLMLAPPSPPASLPPVTPAPAVRPAAQGPQVALSLWPPSLWIGTQPSEQQSSQPPQDRQWVQIPSGPPQQVVQPPQQLSPGFQIVLSPRQQAPQPPQWAPPASPQVPLPPMVQTPRWTPALPPLQLPQSPLTPRLPYQVPSGPGSSGPNGASSNLGGVGGTTGSGSSSAPGSGAGPALLWPYR